MDRLLLTLHIRGTIVHGSMLRKDSLVYDTFGNLSDLLLQSWNDSLWVNGEQEINTLDANEHLRNQLFQLWMDSNVDKY